jgi:hypothetical protein
VQGQARQWQRVQGQDRNPNQLLGLRNRDYGSFPAHTGSSCFVPVVFPKESANSGCSHIRFARISPDYKLKAGPARDFWKYRLSAIQ